MGIRKILTKPEKLEIRRRQIAQLCEICKPKNRAAPRLKPRTVLSRLGMAELEGQNLNRDLMAGRITAPAFLERQARILDYVQKLFGLPPKGLRIHGPDPGPALTVDPDLGELLGLPLCRIAGETRAILVPSLDKTEGLNTFEVNEDQRH